MQLYTVHIARGERRGDPQAIERAILVRDGFSFAAFVFTGFWLLFHRAFLAGVAVLAGSFVLGLILDAWSAAPFVTVGSQLLVSLLVGLEGASLRRWTLARRGWPVVDVVSGASRGEAEHKAIARWLAASAPASPASPPPLPPVASELPAFGLFPRAGA